MSRNMVDRAAASRARRKSRRNTLIWISLAAVGVIVLMYLEQVALLYVLATLGVATLLAVVAFADLRGAQQVTEQFAPADDAAAIGDRTVKTTPLYGSPASRRRR